MDDIDIHKLEQSYLQADAEVRGLRYSVSILEQENKHLRQIIEMLITSQSPSL